MRSPIAPVSIQRSGFGGQRHSLELTVLSPCRTVSFGGSTAGRSSFGGSTAGGASLDGSIINGVLDGVSDVVDVLGFDSV